MHLPPLLSHTESCIWVFLNDCVTPKNHLLFHDLDICKDSQYNSMLVYTFNQLAAYIPWDYVELIQYGISRKSYFIVNQNISK